MHRPTPIVPDAALTDAPVTRSGRPIRVLVLLAKLAGGGGERTVINLLAHADRTRFDLKLGLLEAAGPYLDQVDAGDLVLPRPVFGIPFLTQGSAESSRGFQDLVTRVGLVPTWILQLREMVERTQPDVVLSLMTGLNVMAGASLRLRRGRRVPWIAREGNNLQATLEELLPSTALRGVVRRLIRRSLARTDAALTISQGMAQGLSETLNLPRSRFRVIYNPVDLSHIQERAGEPLPQPPRRDFVLGVGRLEQQKGFDVLIRAYARSRARDQVDLLLLGEGTRRPELQALAAQLGVADSVLMPGFVENPWAYMARARAFVLSSRWEGFGHVVVEAMACGAPTIVTDCDFGPSEIVRHGESGLIVPTGDADGLQSALDAVVTDPDTARRLADGGAARARDFDVARIVAMYEDLLAETAQRGARG